MYRQHRVGKCGGSFVRQGVAGLDSAVLMTTDEHMAVIGRSTGLQRILGAVERHRRNDDLWLCRQPLLQLSKRGVTLCQGRSRSDNSE